MFDCILIANRGEIACRVIRTAKRMGIRTVAVYSDADAHAMHVQMADIALRIGPAPARDSYLNIVAILEAAKAGNARAVHPGYGFLSENADFAQACADAGLVFIGPPPAAIRAMGSKIGAKQLMASSGVPLVPGYHGQDQNPATLQAMAAQIGFPVLLKASAGGGGKGMRIVEREEDFRAALDGAKREALKAFGDDSMLIERYLVRPRHIEIQVFADSQGNCIYLHERDCSIQRRHQKIVEEAPAPDLTSEQRSAIGGAAVRAARAVGYVGAGTVEFIVPSPLSSGERPFQFFFMEMNTRLQVEHPVTEMITGLDLVQWQLQVAAGQTLPLKQADVPLDGHAIEVRIYAENPARDFVPSPGKLSLLRWPPVGEHTRVDTGIRSGDEVTVYYDPMIAKLIVHGADRKAAIERLQGALADCAIEGVKTNIDLLRTISAHPAFAAGDIHTGFIPEHYDALLSEDVKFGVTPEQNTSGPVTAWTIADGWRLNLPPARYLADAKHELGSAGAAPVADLHDGTLSSPMPGQVLQVNVRVGDRVRRGQALMIVEAMKMEHTILAPLDGVVAEIGFGVGDKVEEGAQLLKLTPG